jgi:hypothetical protein
MCIYIPSTNFTRIHADVACVTDGVFVVKKFLCEQASQPAVSGTVVEHAVFDSSCRCVDHAVKRGEGKVTLGRQAGFRNTRSVHQVQTFSVGSGACGRR